ncbi:MAG: helix-turn-helix domain-containing protein [Phycisphaerales bacterium]
MPAERSQQNSPAIGDVLRKQRIEVLDLGLRDVARILDVAPAYITDLEKGRRTPSEALLLRIAQVYRIDEAILRAGWQRPDAVVGEIATQDATSAAKVPEFLRTARSLSAEDWDALIAEAKRRADGGEPQGGAR